MQIRSIYWKNYGSYFGEHHFDLDSKGLVLVEGVNLDEPRMDSNGSGKSTMFEALDWCLYGKPPKEGLADSVVNETAAKVRGEECRVRVEIIGDTGEVGLIERSRAKSSNSLTFKIQGVADRTTLDVDETQKAINRFLGMDRKVFHAAVFFAQTDMVRYADSTDSVRMEILTKILQLDDIDAYLTQAKEEYKRQDTFYSQVNQEKLTLNGNIEQLQQTDYTQLMSDWEISHQKDLESAARAVRAWEQTLVNEQQQCVDVTDYISQIKELEMQKASMPAPDRSELSKLESMLMDLDISVGVSNRETNKVDQEIQNIKRRGVGICSYCNQEISADHQQRELQLRFDRRKELEAEFSKLQVQKAALQQQYDQATTEYQRQETQYRDHLAEWSTKIAEMRSLVSNQKVQQAKVDQIETQVKESKLFYEKSKNEKNPYVEQQRIKEEQLGDKLRQMHGLQQRLSQVESDKVDLDFWITGFGPKGLKSYILDSQLQMLSDAANQWVRLLTGGTIWVRFESQKKTSKKLVNAPDIRVFRWNRNGTVTERSYKNWSGGEKQRISFAIDFGLSRLIANRASKRYELLVLDEVFKHLDRSGREAVMDMLQELSQEKTSLFVIEHDAEFKGMFESIISVTRQNDCSTLKEIRNDTTQK